VKTGFSVFLATFVALGVSWCGLVLAPVLQLGGAKQTVILQTTDNWPLQRPGDATLGLQIYRANGCAACHTEQVRQTGVAFEIDLTSAGKTPAAVSNLISTLKLSGLTKEEADDANQKITAAGGKVETHLIATGADIARGWGSRQSVAADYLYDQPVQLGSLRAGPDLSNIGVRAPDLNWQLRHLYAPKSVNPNSTMPSFKFLFEVRKIGDTPSPDALNLPPEFAAASGYEIVPKPEAKQLAAYLLTLKANAALYEAPFTPVTTAK
jgi:cytochrome c oxidase cbb3-type subunit 2